MNDEDWAGPLRNPRSAYQHGLLDTVQEREPLNAVLIAAGQSELLAWYIRGQLSASKLLVEN